MYLVWIIHILFLSTSFLFFFLKLLSCFQAFPSLQLWRLDFSPLSLQLAPCCNPWFPTVSLFKICMQTALSCPGTRASWDTSCGTHGLVSFMETEAGAVAMVSWKHCSGQRSCCSPEWGCQEGTEVAWHTGSTNADHKCDLGRFCLCVEMGFRRHQQSTLEIPGFW